MYVMPEGEAQGNADTGNPAPVDTGTEGTAVQPALEQGKVAMAQPGGPGSDAGAARGSAILGAEQGIITATETLASTKMDGLVEIAKIEDKGQRIAYIYAIGHAFTQADGGKQVKKHQNYVAELRRVDHNIETRGLEYTMAILNHPEKKGYQERVEMLDKVGNTGGANRGTGAKGVEQAAAAALAGTNLKPDQVKTLIQEALKTAPPAGTQPAPAPTQSSAPVILGGGTPEGSNVQPMTEEVQHPVGASKTKPNVDRIINAMELLDDDDLPEVALAFANRLKRSNSPMWQELGGALIDTLDTLEAGDKVQTAQNAPAAQAANG
jgi:hypothetical protein